MRSLLDSNQAMLATLHAADPSLPQVTPSWADRVSGSHGLQIAMPPNHPATSTQGAYPQPPSPRTYAKIFHKESLELQKVEKSIIVSGLENSRAHTDEASIIEICGDGLGVDIKPNQERRRDPSQGQVRR